MRRAVYYNYGNRHEQRVNDCKLRQVRKKQQKDGQKAMRNRRVQTSDMTTCVPFGQSEDPTGDVSTLPWDPCKIRLSTSVGVSGASRPRASSMELGCTLHLGSLDKALLRDCGCVNSIIGFAALAWQHGS